MINWVKKKHKNVQTGIIVFSLWCNKGIIGDLGNFEQTVDMIKNGDVSLIGGTVDELLIWNKQRDSE